MTSSERNITPDRAQRLLVGALLLALLTPSVLWPIGRSVFGAVRGAAGARAWEGVSPGVIATAGVRSLVVAIVIGVLATCIAYPAARLLARRGALWASLLVTPMLMPSYLAYAGWGLARAPGTWLGDALARAAGAGAHWAPIYVGRSLAILALALWAFPLASIVLAASIARRDPALDDVLRLEPASITQRVRTTLAIHRSAIFSSITLVTLVMLGSSVPLHLAQMDTLAIVIWRELSESARADWWRAWVGASPLIVVGALASWVIGSRLVSAAMRSESPPPRDDRQRDIGRVMVIGAALVWVVGVGAPLALFAITIKSPDSLWRFWRLSAEGVRSSLITSCLVALACLLSALCVSYLLSTRTRGGARASLFALRAMIFAALVPGVLVGASLVEAYPRLDARALPVLSGVARFGFVGAVAACLGAWAEPAARRDARLLCSQSVRAWLIACLPAQWALLLGASIAAGLMSLHEIEASVIVQPPGRGALAQQILSYLHFARLEDMSSAGVWLLGGGTLAAIGTTALIALGARTARAGART